MTEDAAGPPPPRRNPELLGHDAAERTLLDSFNSGRLAHAWLICGPRGIGKATLAYRFARFVLTQGGAGEPAGDGLFGDALPAAAPDSLFVPADDPVFQRVAAGGHADLTAIERRVDEKTGKRKSDIVVDDVRGIGAFMGMTAAEGGWRVAVIDAADDMNRNAANAVLKVLEEPPRGALLLLVSHNPGRLLPTIRSRCRRLVLKPLAESAVADLVGRYRPDITPEDAAELARLAEGSIGRALGLAEEGGLALYREVTGLIGSLPGMDVKALHDLGDRLARPGAEDTFLTVAELLRWWLGRLVVFGARGDDPAADAAERALMARLAAAAPLDRWLEVWDKANRLLGRADSANLDRKQVVLNVFLALQAAVSR